MSPRTPEEASTMKTTYTEDEDFIPTEMRCGKMCIEEIETSKSDNNDEIGC